MERIFSPKDGLFLHSGFSGHCNYCIIFFILPSSDFWGGRVWPPPVSSPGSGREGEQQERRRWWQLPRPAGHLGPGVLGERGRCCDHGRTLTGHASVLSANTRAPQPCSSLFSAPRSCCIYHLSLASLGGCPHTRFFLEIVCDHMVVLTWASRLRDQRLTICKPLLCPGPDGVPLSLAPSCLHLLSSPRSLR